MLRLLTVSEGVMSGSASYSQLTSLSLHRLHLGRVPVHCESGESEILSRSRRSAFD